MFGESSSGTVRAEDHSAMQTLAPSSLQIVMIAINQARKKGHCQVQPLHVAAALLDPLMRSMALHNACLQSLKDSSHLLKCDALDLCFKVALERLPVISEPEKCKEQTMSNALAAALKRAHANERRGTPEQSLQPLLAVKTSTAHLTISILDDPSVSRVFREAGFSSTDVKAKMEETVAQAALVGPRPTSSLFDSPGATSLRRVPYGVSPYSDRLDTSVQLQSATLSVPSIFASAADTRGRPLKYGLQDLQLPESGRVTRQDADAAMFPAQSSRLYQGTFFPRQRDSSTRFGMSRHDAEVRKIVEAFLSPKKRNPVLLSDRRAGPVVKEFSQRLARGEVPLPCGVKLLELPFTSLSVGMLSPEAVEQKLGKLRREVDGCVAMGGAIVLVGDLQWLLEPSQGIAPLVLQQLQQLLASNAANRVWLLSTSTPEAFKAFQFNKNPSLDELALDPIELSGDTKEPTHLPRYGATSSTSWNVDTSFPSQLGSGGRTAANLKPSPSTAGVLEPDMRADCNRLCQLECASLSFQDQTVCLDSGLGSSSPMLGMETPADRHSHRRNVESKKDWACDPLKVNEEESQNPRLAQDVRNAWRAKCSAVHSATEASRALALNREYLTTSIGGMVTRSTERNSRTSDASLPPSSLSKPVPQSSESLTPSPRERIPLHARLALNNTSSFLSPVKPFLTFPNAGGEKRDNNCGTRPEEASLSCTSEAGLAFSPGMSRSDLRHQYASGAVRTDLALGRTSVDSVVTSTPTSNGKGGHQKVQQHPTQSSTLQQPDILDPGRTVPNAGITLSLHGLSEQLGKAVPWQKAAVGAVATAVLRCRSGDGPKMGTYARTNSWLMFLGADVVGKREVARALAKSVYGGDEHLIRITDWSSDKRGKAYSSATIFTAGAGGRMFTGRKPLERLAEAVHQNPCSVLLLEDVDRADFFMRKSLLKARHTGKLQDASGREVSLSDVIIVMTCDAGATLLAEQHPELHAPGVLCIQEDALQDLPLLDFRFQVQSSRSEKVLHKSRNGSLSIVDSASEAGPQTPESRDEFGSILIFGSQIAKRKSPEISSGDQRLLHAKKMKKDGVTKPSTALSLDLNLSADLEMSRGGDQCAVGDPPVTEGDILEDDVQTQILKVAQGRLPSEFFTLLDGVVVFNPFNMRRLTDLVLEKLEQAAEDAMPTKRIPLEIDKALLQVMVFFAWQYFSTLEKFQDWIDNVFVRSMSGALQELFPQADSVVQVKVVERRNEKLPVSDTPDSGTDLLPRPI